MRFAAGMITAQSMALVLYERDLRDPMMRHQLYSSPILAFAIFLLLTGFSAQSSATGADYSNPLDNKRDIPFSDPSQSDPLQKTRPDSFTPSTVPQPHRPRILNEAIEHERMIKNLQGQSPSNEVELNRIRRNPWDQ